MDECSYIIHILATSKKGGHPLVDIQIRCSSYSLLEWLDGYLPDTKNVPNKSTAPLRDQYEKRTLDLRKDVVSESVYDRLVRIFLKAYCTKTTPASIVVTEVHGKTFLKAEKGEATGQDNPEEVGKPLVRLASEMLENKEFIDWKKNSVHMWITNESVIF